MAFKMRTSKFRHVFGKELKKDQCYDGIRLTKVSAETNFCAVNSKFLAIMTEASGGGSFLVLPLSKVGRIERDCPLVSGHKAAVIDLKWSPHNPNLIASASEDLTVKIWQIPDEGLVENLNDDVCTLQDHQKRVNLIEFHPTAQFVLISCGFDLKINLWNCGTATVIRSYDVPDIIYSVSFNYNGTQFATSCKDTKVRVFSAYEETLLKEFKAHPSTKPVMCAFAKDNKIITTGFSRTSERQYAVYDLDKDEQICSENIDQSNGALHIEYDYDTGLIFLWGKGDSIIRLYEITADAPYMHYLNLHQSKESQRGMGWMPKASLNVMNCEIMRCYKLWNNGLCEVLPFTVPRKSDLFQEDLYPDTKAYQAALTTEEFLAGKISDPVTMSLNTGPKAEKREPVKKSLLLSSNVAKPTPTKSEPPKAQQTAASTPAPAPAQTKKPVEKSQSNGPSEPSLPPAKTGPALPAGFDADKMMKDLADLKTIIKRQDKKIESLEKRVQDLEETSEAENQETEADNEATEAVPEADEKPSEDNFEDCQE